ncbi:peptide deformylase [Streptomyces sp. M10(2022)]
MTVNSGLSRGSRPRPLCTLGTVWNGGSGTARTQYEPRGVQVTDMRPSQRMRDLGVVQQGAAILTEPARAFDLPVERDEAERVVDELFAAMDRIGQVHPFAKGMGLAAPQIGIARAAAVVLPPGDAPAIVLLNPRITGRCDGTDEQYEGCLSFFDVRGLVPRPLEHSVETTSLAGETVTTQYERGLARLIHHEIDHLDGLLYTARMGPGSNRSLWRSTDRPAERGLTSRPLMTAMGLAFCSISEPSDPSWTDAGAQEL